MSEPRGARAGPHGARAGPHGAASAEPRRAGAGFARRAQAGRSYRQGVLLGFTLAELTTLLLFASILILGGLLSLVAAKQQELAKFDTRAGAAEPLVPKSDLDRLERDVRELREKLAEWERRAKGNRFVSEADDELLKRIRKLTGSERPELLDLAPEGEPPSPKLVRLGRAQSELLEKLAASGRTPRTTTDVERLLASLQQAEAREQPPIIRLSEEDSYYRFPSGKFVLTAAFEEQIRKTVIPAIVRNGAKYSAHVIEVIGHTDASAVRSSAKTTLDDDLLEYLAKASSGDGLQAVDNVGLGMARAASVARLLRADPRLQDYCILPMSAGQTVDASGDALASPADQPDDPRRRRIEIRVRQLQRGPKTTCP